MNIVTSMHVYNSHLFISFLGKGIRIFPFQSIREKFNNSNAVYLREISSNESLQEIITTRHILLGVKNSSISSFELEQKNESKVDIEYLNQYKANQLSFDSRYSDLYVLTEDVGIININFRNPFKAKISKTIIPESFEKLGDLTVSNMISVNKNILLSIRGFGVSKIDEKNANKSSENIYRTDDAQDVVYYYQKQIVVIADGIHGILLFENEGKAPIKRVALPQSDIPQEIRLFYGRVLVKGKYGLYLYDFDNSSIKVIKEGSIGAIAVYYNYIFFSSNGEINLLSSSENASSHFKLKDGSELDIKLNNYK